MQGELPPPAAVAILKAEMGLDAPSYILYLRWVDGILHGNLGYSYETLRPVSSILLESLQATSELVFAAMFLIVFFGISLGILSAWKEDSKTDRLLSRIAVLGVSIPNYVIGFVGVLIFAVYFQLLPVAGRGSLDSIVLPATALAMSGIAMVTRLTRYGIVEEKRQNYVMAARGKGLSERVIFLKHILRNATPPIINYIGLQMGGLFSGTVIIEEMFAWPGIGRLLVESVTSNDIPVLQGCVLLIGLIFICINFVVDILCLYIDPRIKAEAVV